MDLLTILKYVVVISAAGLCLVILLQARSGGLGTLFGGSGGGEAYRSKRGAEALLYNLTVLLGVVFGASALAIAVLSV